MFFRHLIQKKTEEILLPQLEIDIQEILKKVDIWEKGDEYLPIEVYEILFADICSIKNRINKSLARKLKNTPIFFQFMQHFLNWKTENHQIDINEFFFENTLKSEIGHFFNDVDKVSLDISQRKIALSDDTSTIVVAGAGSGKTLTIAAKVAYLVKYRNIDPQKILLITFTDKSAREMEYRVQRVAEQKIQAYTFHKLGLRIISQFEGYKPSICKDNFLNEIINDYFENSLTGNSQALHRFINYFAYYLNEPISVDDYTSRTDYVDEIKGYDLETLKHKCYEDIKERQSIQGEKVKSLAELQIANFLFLNGINYVYEADYKHNVSDVDHRQYRPDFYLSDYDIYIEHYGIDENNRAKWLDRFEERKYLQSLNWKRETHKKYQTTCLETFSYQAKKGLLLYTLENLLLKHQVEFTPANDNSIIETLIKRDQHLFEEFQKLISTFISILKESGKTSIDSDQLLVKHRIQTPSSISRATHFLEIVKPIFDSYQKELRQNKEIDFSDMINLASEIINNHDILCDYQYVIIDEYQDISQSKSQLIKAIIEQTKAKVFAVGDDWQSIFRFAGSDITLFSNFHNQFSYATTKKIETTHRNSQELVDLSSKFIMQNKDQIPKNVKSSKSFPKPVLIYNLESYDYLDGISFIITNISSIFKPKEILLLGRYNFDLSEEQLKILKSRFSDITIMFSTVHRAKGLEAEHVVILNNRNTILGFPSKIADDPVLSMVLPSEDKYPYAEERRLFYVALTRAKFTCHLLVQNDFSVFIKELLEMNININVFGFSEKQLLKCPRCDGHLIIRQNATNAFYGCSNYPYCSYIAAIDIKKDIKCPICGDYMAVRKGKYGIFYGCNSYKDGCAGTEQI